MYGLIRMFSHHKYFQMVNVTSDSSSEGGEFTGSPLVVSNSTKFLSGAFAWDKNEANQR